VNQTLLSAAAERTPVNPKSNRVARWSVK